MRCILYFAGVYVEWCTDRREPRCAQLTREQVGDYLRGTQDYRGATNLETRLLRAEKNGTSARSPEMSFDQVVRGNRAGPDKQNVPVAVVREWMASVNYGAAPMPLTEWLRGQPAPVPAPAPQEAPQTPSEASEGSPAGAGGPQAPAWGPERLERRRIKTRERMLALTEGGGTVWLVTGSSYYQTRVDSYLEDEDQFNMQILPEGDENKSWMPLTFSSENLGLTGEGGDSRGIKVWPLREQAMGACA